jgi:hypothetical protein
MWLKVGMGATRVKEGMKKRKVTYMPMTDCFFGGSLLMVTSEDGQMQGLRGDGGDGERWEVEEAEEDDAVRQEKKFL